MSDNPKRRHVVSIEIQSDDWESMLRDLRNIEYDLSTHTPGIISIVSGGPTSGYIVKDEYYPDQTHDHYFEEIDTYLQRRKEIEG